MHLRPLFKAPIFAATLLTLAATAAEKKAAPGRWAVLVGVDDYTEIRKLRYAGNDQRAFAEKLIGSGFPEDQVFLLHDKAPQRKYHPNRANIERQLDLVLRVVEDGDLVIVSFSGHGLQIGGKSYFCPIDTQIAADRVITASLIGLDSVYDKLVRSKATLKLLVVDACRNDFMPEGQRSLSLTRSVGEFAGANEKPPEGIMLLSSCGTGQISMEDEQLEHGVFMHFFLEGLGGKAADSEGAITLAGLYDYASLHTKKYVIRKFNGFQTPALKGDINGPFEICNVTARQPLDQGSPNHKYLGVQIVDINDELAVKIKARPHEGVLVTEVFPGSPAEAAGVREGDIIKGFSGQDLTGGNELLKLVERSPIGSGQELRVSRDNQALVLKIEVRARPATYGRKQATEPRETKAFSYASLGLTVTDVTPEFTKQFGLKGTDGALIVDVRKGGPADLSGLRKGMAILGDGRESIKNAAAFDAMMRSTSLKENAGYLFLVQTTSDSHLFVVFPEK